MSFRAAAVVALMSVQGASAAAACFEAKSTVMSSVTSLVPSCFDACAEVCGPLDELISEYMQTFDTEAVKAKICENPEPFKCLLAKQPVNNFVTCKPVLDAAHSFVEEFPMSETGLEAACAALGKAPAGKPSSSTEGEAKDIQAEGGAFSPDANETTQSTTMATTTKDGHVASGAVVRNGVVAAVVGLLAACAAAA